jgi:hypothetical protein
MVHDALAIAHDLAVTGQVQRRLRLVTELAKLMASALGVG